ncbi:MAG: hypothetical protein JWR80_922 [Bradyrhizobium sp.]|nr:hypothetical protein [Bradyrhizobium sp.]
MRRYRDAEELELAATRDLIAIARAQGATWSPDDGLSPLEDTPHLSAALQRVEQGQRMGREAAAFVRAAQAR